MFIRLTPLLPVLFGCVSSSKSTVDSGTAGFAEDTAWSTEEGDSPTPIPVVGEMPLSDARNVFVDHIAERPLQSSNLDGHRHLIQNESHTLYIDETATEPVDFGPHQHIDGIFIDQQRSLLLLDGDIMIFDGQSLEPSPLNAVLPIPATRIEGDPTSLWLIGAGHLFYVHNNTLNQIVFEDREIQRFTLGHDTLGAIAVPELMIVEHMESTTSVVDYRSDLNPSSFGFDQSGTLWAADGSPTLYRRSHTGEWSAVLAAGPIVEVMTHRDAVDTWIRTQNGIIHHRDGVFSPVQLPDGEWQDVDEYGRLLLIAEDSLQISSKRTVATAGLVRNARLEGVTE